MMKATQDLCGLDWRLTAIDPAPFTVADIPARVPGCVHGDLIRAGLIEHPGHGFAERDQQWIGRTRWRYDATLDTAPAVERYAVAELVCDGLDTVATVRLDGSVIGTAQNMHRQHRFPVTGMLAPGEHRLSIEFEGPVTAAEREEATLGQRPVNGTWGPYHFLRKQASSFGWDWGPMVPSAGIWRPLRLEVWSRAAIDGPVSTAVRELTASRAIVAVDGGVVRADDETPAAPERLELTLLGPDGLVAAQHSCAVDASGGFAAKLVVPHPAWWWPRGEGEQPLYTLETALIAGGVEVDRVMQTVGLRTVALDRGADGHGESFAIVVNERVIECRGANWIPEGLFAAEVSPATVEERVADAVDANMNTLRVWGGGVYEQDAFYHACDRAGLLVWQDAMLACAMYPSSVEAEVLAETTWQARRLQRHPSVVLYCGGNEIIEAHQHWGFAAGLKPDMRWGRELVCELLATRLGQVDASRPYWPNSPYSGGAEGDNADGGVFPDVRDPDRGTCHVWHSRVEGYRDLVPRFVAEFGHQSPPCWRTLAETLPPEQLAVDSEAMVHRQRAAGGNRGQYHDIIDERFAGPRDFDSWHGLAQLVQARAIALAIEWWRGHRERCSGTLFWQLNDAWAGHSWSCVDVAGRRKPLWYAVRRACARRVAAVHPIEGRPALVLINDTDEVWDVAARVRRRSFDGEVLAESGGTITVPPRGSHRTHDVIAGAGVMADPARELLEVTTAVGRAVYFAQHDRGLAWPRPRYRLTATADAPGQTTVTVAAETLLRDVILQVDRLDPAARVDEQLITLLPGEEHTFTVAGNCRLAAEDLARWPVFFCANWYGRS